jgi:hypothetical protein
LRRLVVEQHERRVLRGDEMICERIANRLAGHELPAFVGVGMDGWVQVHFA